MKFLSFYVLMFCLSLPVMASSVTCVWDRVEGGDWTNEANWVNGQFATNGWCADFSKLQSGETIQLPAFNPRLSGLIFKGLSPTNQWTLNGYRMQDSYGNIYSLSVLSPDGEPLVFDISNGKLLYNTDSQLNPSTIKRGNGTLSFTDVSLESRKSHLDRSFAIEEGTVELTAVKTLANLNVSLKKDGVLRLSPNIRSIVGSISDSMLENGAIQLNGGTLSIGNGISSVLTKPIQGSGVLDVQNANELILAAKPAETITLSARDGLLTVSNTVTLNPDTSVSILQNGEIAFQGDQQIAHTRHSGPRGGISIAAGKTLTIAEGDATETFVPSIKGQGRLVKEGINVFQYVGGTAPEGGIEVRQGTLKIGTRTEGGGETIRLRFDQASSILTDDSGTLTLQTNGATWEEDAERGGVMRFDGTQSLYQNNVPQKSVLWGDPNYTIAFWFKTPTNSTRPNCRIFWYGDNSGDCRDIQIGFSGSFDKMLVAHFGNDFIGIPTGKSLNDDMWHHFTVIRNGERIQFFLDGNQFFGSMKMKPLRLPSNSCLAIGSYQGLDGNRSDCRYDGWVDDVIVLPYAVENTKVSDIMAGTVPPKSQTTQNIPIPVIHYSFDDADHIGKDSVGVGNDLVLPVRIAGYQFLFEDQETLGVSIADPFSFPIVDAQCVEDAERGKVAYFDGSVDGLHSETTAAGTFVTGQRDFTISQWVKIPTNVSQGAFFHYGQGATGTNLLFGVLRRKLFFSCFGANFDFMDKGSDICDEKWHHVVCVQREKKCSLWCDGKVIATFTISGDTQWQDGDTLDIGSYSCKENWGFKGWMDDVVAVNYTLSDEEIMQLYKGASLSDFSVTQLESAEKTPTGTPAFRVRVLKRANGLNCLQMADPASAPASLPRVSEGKPVTVSCWARVDPGFESRGGVFYWGGNNSIFSLHLINNWGFNTSVMRFAAHASKGTIDYTTVDWMLGIAVDRGMPDFRWHHYVISGSPLDGYYFYVDGVPRNASGIMHNTTLQSLCEHFRIGCRATGEGFQGAIDEFKVFDRVLSKSEIWTLIQSETKNFGDFGSAPVQVAANAKLEIFSESRRVGVLSGEGDVVLNNGELLQNGTGSFNGTISGEGTIGAASGGNLTVTKGLSSFTGAVLVDENSTIAFGDAPTQAKVLLRGSGTVSGAISADVEIPDGAYFRLTKEVVSQGAFVQTSGKILVNGGGKVSCEEGLFGRFTLATGAEVTADTLDQWTAISEGMPFALTKFHTENGIFSVTVGMPGTVLLLR